MSDIRVAYGGSIYQFAPGTAISVGRAPECTIVVSDPTVSREHLQITDREDGWWVIGVGRSPTYLNGQPVDQVRVTGPVAIHLGSPQGPPLHIETVASPENGPRPAVMPGVATPGLGDTHPLGLHAAGVHEFVSAVHILVPLRSWLTNRGWRAGWRLLVIPYALLPLVFLQLFANTTNPSTPGWAYSLYVAPLWALAFYLLIRPGRIGGKEFAAAIAIVGLVLVLLQIFTIPIEDQLNLHEFSFPAALGVGFTEEVTKALPILAIALIVRGIGHARWDVRMWMFLGTISGLTFGVREAAPYTAGAVLQINHNPGLVIVDILQFAFRVFVDGFVHATWAGISAFFIGMGINYARRRVQLIVAGISVVAVLHGLNDWTLVHTGSAWPAIGIQGFSLLFFLGYTLTAHSIEQQVRRSPIFRGESLLADGVSESTPAPP